MATLMDIVTRKVPPVPWEEGDNIPWTDPAFSGRMLREHLSQDHDSASRRMEKIDEQIGWIHREVLSRKPGRVLDLCCGPGLYTSRLAGLGHSCHGIDFGPASVAWAKENDPESTYTLADVRNAEFGERLDLVMMIFGQFNVFRRAEARGILSRSFHALAPGGAILLEPQRFEQVRGTGRRISEWSTLPTGGLFSDAPYLYLTEIFWDEEARASTHRFIVIDPTTGSVSQSALTNEAYTDDDLRTVLAGAGFEDVRIFPSLIGKEDEEQAANVAVLGRRPLS